MGRGVAVLIVVATVGIPAAAGGASDRRPAKAATAAALAAVMTERGVACDPFLDSDDSGAPTVPGGPPQGDTAECVVDGATGSMVVYSNARELGRAFAAMPVVCRFAVAVLGPVEFTYVTGKSWSLSFFRDEYDPAVGKALGGKVREVDCTELAKR